jgi:hypothetical protein
VYIVIIKAAMKPPQKRNMKKMKATKKQIKQFAARFSFDDWSYLTGKMEFLNAVEAGEFEQAEVIANRLLTEQ